LESARQLSTLLESPELAVIAHKLTCALFSRNDEKLQLMEANAVNELQELVRLSIGYNVDEAVHEQLAKMVFTHLRGTIAAFVLESELAGVLRPSIQARTLAVASQHVSASERNVKLLDGLRDREEIGHFVGALRRQVHAVFAKMRLPYTGSTRMVPYADLYVEPTLKFIDGSPASLHDIVKTNLRVIVTGNPGGGKSTLATKIALDTATGMTTFLTEATVPLIIVLRDYAEAYSSSKQSLVSFIEETCKSLYHLTPPNGAIEYLLLNGHALVVLDGLDELVNIGLRRSIVDMIHGFTNLYPTVPIFATSRHIGYERVPLDPDQFMRITLDAFEGPAVETYAENWFRLDETIPPGRAGPMCKAFIRDSELVPDLRSNPLMLALMCGIYSTEGYIPKNRPDVYERCANLLFERWDRERNISSQLPFNAHVRSAIYALAAWLYKLDLKSEGVRRSRIEQFMTDYLHRKRFERREEAEDAARDFIDYCTGRAWVLTDVGADAKQARYDFTHRTFLEYFAAKQLSRDCPTAEQLFEALRGELEAALSDVVSEIAVQILGENVEDGADDFLEYLCEAAESQPEHCVERTNLITFGARSLGFLVPRPSVIARLTKLSVRDYAHRPSLDGAIHQVMCATLETLPSVQTAALQAVRSELAGEMVEAVAALALYPAGVAAINADRYTAGHDAYWDSVSYDWRRTTYPIIAKARKEWGWLAQYRLAQGLTTPEQVLSHQEGIRLFLSSESCSWALLQPLASAIAWSLAGSSPPRGRNDVIRGYFLREQVADSVTQILLNLQRPWLTADASSARWTREVPPQVFAMDRLSSDKAVNGLYAMLVLFQADLHYVGRPMLESVDRKEYWRAATNDLFSVSRPATMAAPVRVRTFVQRWLGGGIWLVR